MEGLRELRETTAALLPSILGATAGTVRDPSLVSARSSVADPRQGDAGEVLCPPDMPHSKRFEEQRLGSKPGEQGRNLRPFPPRRPVHLVDHGNGISEHRDVPLAQHPCHLKGVEQGQPLRLVTGARPQTCLVIQPAGSDHGRLHLARVRAATAVEEDLHPSGLPATAVRVNARLPGLFGNGRHAADWSLEDASKYSWNGAPAEGFSCFAPH